MSDRVVSERRKQARNNQERRQRVTSNIFSAFTQQEIQEFKEAFNLIDQNHDGYIDHDDLIDMMTSLGAANVSDDEVANMLNDAPGPVNFTMFLTMFSERLQSTDPGQVLLNAFRMFDEELTGYVSEDRLRHVLTSFGNRWTQEMVDELYHSPYLVDHRGFNYVEFVRRIKGYVAPDDADEQHNEAATNENFLTIRRKPSATKAALRETPSDMAKQTSYLDYSQSRAATQFSGSPRKSETAASTSSAARQTSTAEKQISEPKTEKRFETTVVGVTSPISVPIVVTGLPSADPPRSAIKLIKADSGHVSDGKSEGKSAIIQVQPIIAGQSDGKSAIIQVQSVGEKVPTVGRSDGKSTIIQVQSVGEKVPTVGRSDGKSTIIQVQTVGENAPPEGNRRPSASVATMRQNFFSSSTSTSSNQAASLVPLAPPTPFPTSSTNIFGEPKVIETKLINEPVMITVEPASSKSSSSSIPVPVNKAQQSSEQVRKSSIGQNLAAAPVSPSTQKPYIPSSSTATSTIRVETKYESKETTTRTENASIIDSKTPWRQQPTKAGSVSQLTAKAFEASTALAPERKKFGGSRDKLEEKPDDRSTFAGISGSQGQSVSLMLMQENPISRQMPAFGYRTTAHTQESTSTTTSGGNIPGETMRSYAKLILNTNSNTNNSGSNSNNLMTMSSIGSLGGGDSRSGRPPGLPPLTRIRSIEANAQNDAASRIMSTSMYNFPSSSSTAGPKSPTSKLVPVAEQRGPRRPSGAPTSSGTSDF